MTSCSNPQCLGNYDFEQISYFARKRFIEGYETITLLQQAKSQCEREEIALVSLLDVDDKKIRDLQLSCTHAKECAVTNCREKLIKMIEKALARISHHRS